MIRLTGCLLFCVLNLLVQAQQAYFAIRHYTTDHGLPSPEVYDILEDRQGYLWFSTDNGVSRFNGYAFENFGPKQGLQNNVVFFMQEDNQGRIWMPTLSGNVYFFEGDTIKPYPYNHILEKFRIRYRQLGEFYVDKKGVFHAGLLGYGFIAIQPDGDYRLYSDELPCGVLIYEVEDQFLNVVIPCSRDSMELEIQRKYKAQQKLRTIFFRDSIQKHLDLFNDQPREYTGETVIKFRNGSYLSYRRGYLYHFDDQKNLLWAQPYPRAISFMSRGENDRIYLTDDWGKGIRVYENVAAIPKNEYKLLLNDNTVSHVTEDKFGGIWFATIDNGVFYAPNQEYEVYNEFSGLSNQYVTSVVINDKDQIWIGLHNGDVYQLFCNKGQLNRLPPSENDNEVFDLEFEVGRQRLWKGARRLEYLENGRWNTILDYHSGLNLANKKFKIYPESDKIIGATAGPSGFGIIKLSTAEAIFYSNKYPELSSRTLVTYQDFSNRIWVGRIDGLFEFRDSVLVRPSPFPEVLNYRVEDMAQLQDSTFVIGTKGAGVIFWKDNRFFQLNESEGLTASMIENIHIDATQKIWVGTLNGLNRISWNGPDDFTIEKLTLADGLPSNEINDITSWDQDIWVATTRGLVRLPAETATDSTGSAPVLEQLLINNKPMALDSPLVLPHFRNHFQLKFLTINYQLNGQIDYRYRLNPDNDWIITKERNINLAALAPDQYEFEIQSQNEDSFWSDSTRLIFIIRPPFWQTIWFWVLVALLLLGSAWLFYRFRVRQLKRASKLEREKVAVEKQVMELKQAALRAQMNPHFIFNCLNSIQGFIASGDKGKATRYLARFAKLIRATLDSTMEGSIPLKKDIEILENYLEMEQMRFKQKFDYHIKIDDKIDLFEITVPPLLVQPYVENSILHGLIHPLRHGKLDISYEQDGAYLKVSIIDNGIGIFESRKQKSKQVVTQQPRGMSITRRRLELLDHTNKSNKVRVEELKGESGEVLGTKVTLHIGLE